MQTYAWTEKQRLVAIEQITLQAQSIFSSRDWNNITRLWFSLDAIRILTIMDANFLNNNLDRLKIEGVEIAE